MLYLFQNSIRELTTRKPFAHILIFFHFRRDNPSLSFTFSPLHWQQLCFHENHKRSHFESWVWFKVWQSLGASYWLGAPECCLPRLLTSSTSVRTRKRNPLRLNWENSSQLNSLNSQTTSLMAGNNSSSSSTVLLTWLGSTMNLSRLCLACSVGFARTYVWQKSDRYTVVGLINTERQQLW